MFTFGQLSLKDINFSITRAIGKKYETYCATWEIYLIHQKPQKNQMSTKS